MDPSPENKDNKILRYFRELPGKLRQLPGKWTIKMRGEFADDEDRRHYRETLKRRRTRVICLKLLANALFLFTWSFVSLNANMDANIWPFEIGLIAGNFWADFSVYAGISGCLPLFCFLGLLRERTPVSQVWFEVVWLFGVFVFDGFLIYRQTLFLLDLRLVTQVDEGDPYFTASVVLHGLTVASLAIDLLLSFLWSGFLCVTAAFNHKKHPWIWVSHAQNFPWLSDKRSTSEIPQPHWRQLILGAAHASEPRPTKSIPEGITSWLLSSTMFRQIGTEPLSHSLLRGGLAVVLWVILLAYGILNCIINPIRQFTLPQGLPKRYLPSNNRDTTTVGLISGFIGLDGIPMTQPPLDSDDEGFGWKICDSILSEIQANSTNPSTGKVTACNSECYGYSWNQIQKSLQIEIYWDCGYIWDVSGFQNSESVPDSRPYVSVVWNSSAYQSRPVVNAGIYTFAPGISEISAHEESYMQYPTVKFTAGQSLGVDVGRRTTYLNRATFRDLIGIPQSPIPIIMFPFLPLVPGTPSIDPQLTTLNFYPRFGAYYDEVYEEYLEHTVVWGLSVTGR